MAEEGLDDFELEKERHLLDWISKKETGFAQAHHLKSL
jgi:hypothetical protein